jgi:hypothetical protein
VDVTLTLTPGATHRAVVVFFRGTTPISGTATASLGALLTFAIGENVSLAPADLVVKAPTSAQNTLFEEVLENDGAEPVVAKGMTAILDGDGAIVGKARLDQHRLLPGERCTLKGEFAGELASGRYRVVATISYEGRAFTRTGELVIP